MVVVCSAIILTRISSSYIPQGISQWAAAWEAPRKTRQKTNTVHPYFNLARLMSYTSFFVLKYNGFFQE
jgi:hypothetical protein